MKKILGTSFISKFLIILVLSLLLTSGAKAGCDDAPTDGVDYSNCQFSEGQDLSRAYIPNSNLSFISFIKVTFDKGVMMNATLSNGNFVESSFIRTNLYEANLEGGIFEKANFSSANLTRVNFKGSSLIETNFTNSNLFDLACQFSSLVTFRFLFVYKFGQELRGIRCRSVNIMFLWRVQTWVMLPPSSRRRNLGVHRV